MNCWYSDLSVEMRHSVTTLIYILRKFLDNLLYSLSSPLMVSLESLAPVLAKVPYPPGKLKGWLPLYTMVTFRPDISYATVRKKSASQAAVLTRIIWIGVVTLCVAGTWTMWLAQRLLINYIHDSKWTLDCVVPKKRIHQYYYMYSPRHILGNGIRTRWRKSQGAESRSTYSHGFLETWTWES